MLASRSGRIAPEATAEWAQLRASDATVFVRRCDVADASATRRLLAATAAIAAPLRGVWHAAGVLADGLLPKQTAETLAKVFGPKAHGAWTLQRACAA